MSPHPPAGREARRDPDGPGAPKRRNGYAAFRAIEADVRAALDAGWTLVAIYEVRRDQLAISYAQFARYVQRLRRVARSPGLLVARSAGEQRRLTTSPQRTRTDLGTGPPKGRPEEAIPTLDMDGFAEQALRNKDLF